MTKEQIIERLKKVPRQLCFADGDEEGFWFDSEYATDGDWVRWTEIDDIIKEAEFEGDGGKA